MPNSSQTGGALQITPDSFNIYHVIHDFIVGLVGFTDNTLVRPMYQVNPPTIPPFGTDWIAFNITQRESNGSSYQTISTSNVFTIKREITIYVSMAIYGTNSYQNSSIIRAGMEIQQNLEMFRPYNIAFGRAGNPIRSPELHNLRWLDRYNLDFSLNHVASNTASIISVVSATDTIVVNR